MIENEKQYELMKFEDGEFSLDVNVSPSEDTVWLNKKDLSLLFARDRTVKSRHIKNILLENELDLNSVSVNFAHTASDGKTYNVEYFNLDMIISVGYRVNHIILLFKIKNSYRELLNNKCRS